MVDTHKMSKESKSVMLLPELQIWGVHGGVIGRTWVEDDLAFWVLIG